MYNYRIEMKQDIRNYIDWNVNIEDFSSREEMEEKLYDEMFIADDVTGNASGSYTFNSYKADEYVCHNLDLAAEAYAEFGYDQMPVEDLSNTERIDVTIRCYLLGQLLAEVLEEMENNGELNFAEE